MDSLAFNMPILIGRCHHVYVYLMNEWCGVSTIERNTSQSVAFPGRSLHRPQASPLTWQQLAM